MILKVTTNRVSVFPLGSEFVRFVSIVRLLGEDANCRELAKSSKESLRSFDAALIA